MPPRRLTVEASGGAPLRGHHVHVIGPGSATPMWSLVRAGLLTLITALEAIIVPRPVQAWARAAVTGQGCSPTTLEGQMAAAQRTGIELPIGSTAIHVDPCRRRPSLGDVAKPHAVRLARNCVAFQAEVLPNRAVCSVQRPGIGGSCNALSSHESPDAACRRQHPAPSAWVSERWGGSSSSGATRHGRLTSREVTVAPTTPSPHPAKCGGGRCRGCKQDGASRDLRL